MSPFSAGVCCGEASQSLAQFGWRCGCPRRGRLGSPRRRVGALSKRSAARWSRSMSPSGGDDGIAICDLQSNEVAAGFPMEIASGRASGLRTTVMPPPLSRPRGVATATSPRPATSEVGRELLVSYIVRQEGSSTLGAPSDSDERRACSRDAIRPPRNPQIRERLCPRSAISTKVCRPALPSAEAPTTLVAPRRSRRVAVARVEVARSPVQPVLQPGLAVDAVFAEGGRQRR
jgi:hypothetical protein